MKKGGVAAKSLSAPGAPKDGLGGIILAPMFLFMAWLIWQGLKKGW